MQDQTFTLLVDSVPVDARAVPFKFNEETRFTVTINGSEYMFVFDTSIGRYAAIGDESATLPDNLEVAVADRLKTIVT